MEFGMEKRSFLRGLRFGWHFNAISKLTLKMIRLHLKENPEFTSLKILKSLGSSVDEWFVLWAECTATSQRVWGLTWSRLVSGLFGEVLWFSGGKGPGEFGISLNNKHQTTCDVKI